MTTLSEFNKRSESVHRLLESNPELTKCIDVMFNYIDMFHTVLPHKDLSADKVFFLMLWLNIQSYHKDALFLILGKNIDAGFALLRLAAELARDIARMDEDVTNLEMWKNKNRKKIYKKDYYKDTFQFKTEDSLEKLVFKQYNHFSTLGVHHHLGLAIHGEVTQISEDRRIATIDISDEKIIGEVAQWILAYFPVNEMCMRVFNSEINDMKDELGQISAEFAKIKIAIIDYALNIIKEKT